jgi:uncharacterized protein YraI
MLARRPFVKIALAVYFGLAASSCTRSVDLLQTPLTPPLSEPSLESQTDAEAVRPTSTASQVASEREDAEAAATSSAAPEIRYAVIFLADGEVLNVRAGPGVTNPVVGSLQANARDLIPTGKRQDVDGVTWIEIEQPEGGEGWVSSDFLTEQATPARVCSDPQVGLLLDQFGSAVRNQDGRALAALVSPRHGLTIHHNVWNSAVVLRDPQVFGVIFNSTTDYDWGIADGSGDPLVGPFKDIILPKLENVLLQSHTRNCNTLERGVATGGTTGFVYWPYDYASLSYVAIYRPPPPDQELDWRTWVVGIEYVEGKPYLAVLIQFHWEI